MKVLKATVNLTPTNPTKEVGTMQDTTTKVIMIIVTTTKAIMMTGTAEGMATKIITVVFMAGVEGSVVEGAEDVLQTRLVEAAAVDSMATAKDKVSPRKATEETASKPLALIPALTPQQYILLQSLLQPMVDESLVVDSIEEGAVVVAEAISTLPPSLLQSNGCGRRTATQEVPVAAVQKTAGLEMAMLLKAERDRKSTRLNSSHVD